MLSNKNLLTGSNIRIGQNSEIPEDFFADIEPFKKIGSRFYYINNQGNSNWYTALMKCGEMGANLANLQSLEDVDAIRKELERGHKYWIDLTNLPENGKFRSVTTGELKNKYPIWKNGKPQDAQTKERCVHLSTKEISAVIEDQPCTYQYNFICETNLPRTISIVHW